MYLKRYASASKHHAHQHRANRAATRSSANSHDIASRCAFQCSAPHTLKDSGLLLSSVARNEEWGELNQAFLNLVRPYPGTAAVGRT
eukprot:2108244-Rhodomonas_salina.3